MSSSASNSQSQSQSNSRQSYEAEAAPSYSYEKDAISDESQYQTDSYQSGNSNSYSNQQSQSSQNQNQVLFDSSDSATQHPQQHYSDSNQNQQRGGGANPNMTMPMPSNNLNHNSQGFSFNGPPNLSRPDHASYATSAGWGISNLAAAAWFLPPFSSVYVLVVETENDLARFHAYQSGLCGVTFFFLMWFLRSWLGWYTLSVIIAMGFFGWSWVCSQTAYRAAPTLTRMPYLPYFAEIAERWVGEE